jgi:hypothetical protein
VFPDAATALRHVLSDKPRVLGVGEIHSKVGAEDVPATLVRFREELLPVLAPHTTDLVIETWRVDGRCGEEAAEVTVQVEVELERPEVVESDIVRLAKQALALGVQPHDLVLACEEYGGLRDAEGEVAYDALLTLLTSKLRALAMEGLETEGASVVLYGGAVHNDLSPSEGLRDYSYGVDVGAAAKGAYVELDLYAPEQLAVSPALVEDAWSPLLDLPALDEGVVLFQRMPGSYVMLLRREGSVVSP